MFNTFPTQSSAESTSTTTSSSGDLGPILKHSPLPAFEGALGMDTLEGFSSSPRSSIELPFTNVNGLTMTDSTGSVIWDYDPVNFNAAVDNWRGFWMNDDATLLYVFAININTNPDTYYTFTVDAAGTIIEIGNDQPAVDFSNSGEHWVSGSSVQPDGTGSFKILHNLDSSAGQYAVLDAAGQFTTQPTNFYEDGMVLLPSVGSRSPYETESGYIISDIEVLVDGRLEIGITKKYTSLLVNVSRDTFVGYGTTIDCGIIRWRDYVITWSSGGARTALVKYSISDFDKYASEMAVYYGVEE